MFGTNEKVNRLYSVLVPIDIQKDVDDLFLEGNFAAPEDLRKIIVLEKLKGQLTNVFYSMNAGNTDFYAHQFKPVMKFIESVRGRMLIADEVGLGKTIESIYIWKELQARSDARRLLIICPAMLCPKWQADLYNRFGIDSEIVKGGQLSDTMEQLIDSRDWTRSFVYIVSIEAVRPKASFREDVHNRKATVRFARILEQSGIDADFSLFDLVIIDEAHYMRNPGTASNRLGHVVRDAAQNLLLLTATPIQTTNYNLYEMLRLVDPDIFFSKYLFDFLMESNQPVIETMRALQHSPFDRQLVLKKIDKMFSKKKIKEDPSLNSLRKKLRSSGEFGPADIAEYSAVLESRSVLSGFMSRTRKRDVIENTVVRDPKVMEIRYSEYESSIYCRLSQAALKEAEERTGIPTFVQISRQRQMASCLPAAIECWRSGEYMEALQEWLWEDMGMTPENVLEDLNGETDSDFTACEELEDYGIDIDRLTMDDSKYDEFHRVLREIYEKSPGEKCVVFAFFRGTLKYLLKRLTEDGFTAAAIMGGISPAEKMEIIGTFSLPSGPQILLSSEVGSEGIDLQFCSILFNYDLPWNPMRVEQRIGRIDRLGQKASKITIYHFTSFQTVEERILYRLYERINIFKESIGDLEEILGEITSELKEDVYNPELSEDEKWMRSDKTIRAIENKRKLQNSIEDNAINLVGFSEYLYRNIHSIRDNNRWIQSGDLYSFVTDFFNWNYKGFALESDDSAPWRFRLSLPAEAKYSLNLFIGTNKPQKGTELHRRERVHCSFDSKEGNKRYEKVDIIHPLIQWIRDEYEQADNVLNPVSVMELTADGIDPGAYIYYVQRWRISGLKEYDRMVFLCYDIIRRMIIPENVSEKMVLRAIENGTRVLNPSSVIGGYDDMEECFLELKEELLAQYERVLEERTIENSHLCENQLESAKRYRDRRVNMYLELIRRYREQGTEKMIPATEGHINKENTAYENKKALIGHTQQIEDEIKDLAAGVILVK